MQVYIILSFVCFIKSAFHFPAGCLFYEDFCLDQLFAFVKILPFSVLYFAIGKQCSDR